MLWYCLIALLLQQSMVIETIHIDCNDQTCGDVFLSHPFSLTGTNCSKNEYFEVTCVNATKPRAILKKMNLELTDQQPVNDAKNGYVTVKIPVPRTCVDEEHSLDLSGSPFSFDNSRNVFASLSCSGNASVYRDDQKIGGCNATCYSTHEEVVEGCQSELSSARPFPRYTLRFTRGRRCTTGFLTSRTFLEDNFTLAAAMVDFAVPVVLLWTDKDYIHKDEVHRDFKIIARSIALTIGISCIFLTIYNTCIAERRRQGTKYKKKYFKARLEKEWPSNSNSEVIQKTKLFTVKDLEKATDDFNEEGILGQGGQGTVYKGILTNGQVIAVKKSKDLKDKQWKEFLNEVILLSKVQHRNVVKLLGCCLDKKALMLVYEFIPNGTLSEYLLNSKEIVITWEMRIRIACEVAQAISYLHYSLPTQIYHRDIKSTNILLDENYRAKVADFGISKVVPMDKTHITTNVQGTFGYFDPEYFQYGRFSEKGDVFSFGVILIELLTGQLPIRKTTSEGERSLVQYFKSSMKGSTLDKILDPIAIEGRNTNEVMFIASLAKRCLKKRGIERPTMKEVTMELESIRKRLPNSNVAQQASFEIHNVPSTSSTSPIAHTCPLIGNQVNIMVGDCYDKEISSGATW